MQCTGTTKTNRRCKRTAEYGDRCGTHRRENITDRMKAFTRQMSYRAPLPRGKVVRDRSLRGKDRIRACKAAQRA